MYINDTSWSMEFLIINASSSYNGLISRPALNQFKANMSTYSLTLEVRTATGLFAIWGYRSTGREYFLAANAKAEHGASYHKRRRWGVK